MSSFRFKQFTITQQNVPMKVNTDGVLLGAWADVDNASTILDIGTGTGVIALMLAQRNLTALVDAVEIDQQAVAIAEQNIANSPWSERIAVIGSSFQAYADSSTLKYNLIVSNPPFFLSALKSPSQSRNLSRHADILPYEALLEGVDKLLAETGVFAGVFPYAESNVFIALAVNFGLYCRRKIYVQTVSGGRIKRVLLELSRERVTPMEGNLAIEEHGGNGYTADYRNLTKDFYLAF
ncbi:MAG TPA: methyltransferase [Williamwhitmania sp.]|nr:methyltransferase [Williamwhitmania sp.]